MRLELNRWRARALAALTPVVLILLLATRCDTNNNSGITVAGSTSVQPFAERLAELYMHAHPGCKVNVQGGGSSAGIRAVRSRVCEIGMSSRELHGDESTLTAVPIAYDAIVVIVNVSNPVRNLTIGQTRAIFAGRIRNWRELGGPDLNITVVTREEGSGTRASFEEHVMADNIRSAPANRSVEPFAADALVQDSNGAVREIVAADKAAIGYISAGLVDNRVRALSLDGISPSEENIRSGVYPISRRFLFLTINPVSTAVQHFIDFTLSDSGQRALVEEGLIRVR